jgi:hypothetical protein
MTTPAMVLSCVLKLMVVSVGVFWVVSFCVSRVFVFYEAYSAFIRILKDEEWLRQQCALPEFYSNLRQHTDLCNAVRLNAERSPVLIALNEVANTAHLCGRYSCTEALTTLSSAGWPAIVALVATLLMTPSILSRIVRGVVHGEHLPTHSQHLKYL